MKKSIDEVIGMAWSDKISFEEIKKKSGLSESEVISIMRKNLKKKRTEIKRFHGPADSIYGAHRTDNEIDTKTGYFSTFAALISAGGGASVGQYGPLVHFGATLGTSIRILTRNALSTDIFIGCGTAAAISAGFNAPIAGLVFCSPMKSSLTICNGKIISKKNDIVNIDLINSINKHNILTKQLLSNF